MARYLTRRVLAVTLAAGVAAVGAGSALAAGGPPPGARANCTGAGPVGTPAAPMTAAADYLGVTLAQLRAEKRAGNSLADVAATKGKSVAGLEQAMVAAAKTNLDKALAAGRITEAQRTAALAQLEARIEAMIEATAPAYGGGRGMGFRGGR